MLLAKIGARRSAKSSTLPHDPVYVDKQVGVTEE